MFLAFDVMCCVPLFLLPFNYFAIVNKINSFEITGKLTSITIHLAHVFAIMPFL